MGKVLIRMVYAAAGMAVMICLAGLVGYAGRAPIARAIDDAYQQAVADARFIDTGCYKVWAHRGLFADAQENSIASVLAAFAKGAGGVEVDILYDVAQETFYVSHDRPYQLHDGNPLTLDALLAQTAHFGMFWLDAKDLEELAPWQARRAVGLLEQLLQRHELQERAFVESRNPLYLAWLAERGIHTSFLVSPNEKKYRESVYLANLYIMKLAYTLGPFGALSMNDSRYSVRTAAFFGDQVPVLLSTVNARPALIELVQNPRVRIVLSDEPHYDISACTKAS